MTRLSYSLVALVLLLVACGGGANEPPAPTEPDPPEPTSAVAWVHVGDMTKVEGVT